MKNSCIFLLVLLSLMISNSFCGEKIELPLFIEVYDAFNKALYSSNPHNNVKKIIEEYKSKGIVDPINYCTPHGHTLLDIKRIPSDQFQFLPQSKPKKTIEKQVKILALFGAKAYRFRDFLHITSEHDALRFCRKIKTNLVNFYNWYRNNNPQPPLLQFLIKKRWFNVYTILFKNHNLYSNALKDLDQDGNTLLFHACRRQASLPIIQALVTEIDVNKKNTSGFTAIFDAHNKETFNYLRECGANLDIQGKGQQNIMHYAVRLNNCELLKTLIKGNFDLQFDLFKRDGFGSTPKDLIQSLAKPEKVRKLLEKYYPYMDKVVYFES